MTTASQAVKSKPVATVGTAATIVTALIGYAVVRGWISTDLAALLEPVVLAVAATIMHALVSPYEKVKTVLERGLHIGDADFGRMEALLEQYGLQIVQKATAVPAEVSTPAAPAVPAAEPAAPQGAPAA